MKVEQRYGASIAVSKLVFHVSDFRFDRVSNVGVGVVAGIGWF